MFRSSEGACSAFDFARVVSSLVRDLILLFLDRVCFENIGICFVRVTDLGGIALGWSPRWRLLVWGVAPIH